MITRLLILLALTTSTTAATLLLLRPPALGIDDAHIFFVYASHLVQGGGLVFNLGGERVEGFSSPLWMVLVAGSLLISPEPALLLLLLTGAAVSVGLAALWYGLDRLYSAAASSAEPAFTLPGLLVLIWAFSSPSFAIWNSITLMDTGIWTALLLAAASVLLFWRQTPLIMALVVALLCARPEGMLWAAALILLASGLTWLEQGAAAARRLLRAGLALYIVTLATLTTFRLYYFGYPLPNTYYAKMSPDLLYNQSHGLRYLLAFLQSHWLLPAAVLLLFLMLVVAGRQLWQRQRPAPLPPQLLLGIGSLLPLTGLLIPVWTGGDHFALFRFYQPVWPLLMLPAAALLGLARQKQPTAQPAAHNLHTLRRLRAPALAAAAALICLLGARVNWFNVHAAQAMANEFTIAARGREVGRTLNDQLPRPLPSIGLITVGGAKREYAGPVVDLVGLNNRQMAHAPGDRYGFKNHAAFDPTVFWQQAPNLMLPLLGADGADVDAQFAVAYSFNNGVLKGLLSQERFLTEYSLVLIPLADGHLLTYSTPAYAASLAEQGLAVQPYAVP